MSAMREPRDQQLENLRERFRREGVLSVVETTPKYGGVRGRDVRILVAEGFVEWVVPGASARLVVRKESAA